MKKLILLLLFIPLVSFGQSDEWTYTEQRDEFGDKTGEGRWTYITYGTFSNSATLSSKATLILGNNPEELVFAILEYESNPASFMCDQINIAVKTESGKIYRETKTKFETTYSNGIPIMVTGDYTYGDKSFFLSKPDKKRMRWVQKNRAKGIVDLYLLLTTSRGEFKIAITCGGSKYNFKLKGFLEKSS